MKIRVCAILLLAALTIPLLTGCNIDAVEEKLDAVGDAVEDRLDPGDAVPKNPPKLTEDQAKDIALKHAGLNADQVRFQRTEFEMDRGVPQYDIEFENDSWEYEYELHADTGEILSYDRDDL